MTTFADDVVTALKAGWIQGYIALNTDQIINGTPSKFKDDELEWIMVFNGSPGEEGRINDNSAKIATDTATIKCISETPATAKKYQLMCEQIVELYTYPQGGGFWTATFITVKESNDIEIEGLFVKATLFKVRAVIS